MAHAISKIIRREEILGRINREKAKKKLWKQILNQVTEHKNYETNKRKRKIRRILEDFDPLHYHTIRGGNPPRVGTGGFFRNAGPENIGKLASWITSFFSRKIADGALAAIGNAHALPGEIETMQTYIEMGSGITVGASSLVGAIWVVRNYPYLATPLKWMGFIPKDDDNSLIAEGIRAAAKQPTNTAKSVQDYMNENIKEVREFLRANPATEEVLRGLHITLNEAENLTQNGVHPSQLYALPLLASYLGVSAALGKARFFGNLASLICMLFGLDPAKRTVIFTLIDLVNLFKKLYDTPKEQRYAVFKDSCKGAVELLISRLCAGYVSRLIWRNWIPGIIGWFRQRITKNTPIIGSLINYLATTRPGQWIVGTLDQLIAEQIQMLLLQGKDPEATSEYITGDMLYGLISNYLEPMGWKFLSGIKMFVDFVTSKQGEIELRAIGRSAPPPPPSQAPSIQANRENAANVDLVPEDDIAAANASASASASDPGPSATAIVVRPQIPPSLPDDDDDDDDLVENRRGVRRWRPRTEEEVLENTVNMIRPVQRRRLNNKNETSKKSETSKQSKRSKKK